MEGGSIIRIPPQELQRQKVLRCMGVSKVLGWLRLALRSFLQPDWVSSFFASLSTRSFQPVILPHAHHFLLARNLSGSVWMLQLS